ncbi:MAG: AMP-binding protein [Pseudomonadota bacterium]
MTEEFWQSKYPDSLRKDIDLEAYDTLLNVFETACRKFRNRPAFSNMGHVLTYGDLDRLSANFASYLQNHTALKRGDCVAIQLPNILQYPVVLFGIIRAGMIVVNTNPLYTAREMTHQFNDAGCKAIIALANFGHLVAEVVPNTSIETVIITELGDALPPLRRQLVNTVVKYVKKLVPKFKIKNAVSYLSAMESGRRSTFRADFRPDREDVAVLQYTGGTTGVAKGAMLTHANLVSNMLQMNMVLTDFEPGKETIIAPLPLYHIFCFTVSCMAIIELGGHSVLITNPRDIPAFVKELKRTKFTAFAGLNTLFVALMNDPQFKTVDFSKLKMTISGGMALQKVVAENWKKATGCQICEGYGMTETSPVISVNPPQAIQIGTIGLPVYKTKIRILNDANEDVALGEVGELCVQGPQVMKGYWNKPEATAETIIDGWLHTGDIALVQDDGYIKIVDRKKDMIIVSGFNVYPNEIEDVMVSHPDILEVAAIGVPDDKSGEAVKIFVVTSNANLTEAEVKKFARDKLTGYKIPKFVEFRTELPKSNVGKILKRELRPKEDA